jgi:membrane associated rhomboid family serine protease
MDVLAYISISIAGLLAGAALGCIGGLSLGWLLALGYHRHGPSDPGDAPVYVSMGLMLVGACLGALAGFVIGVIYCVRLARRKALNRSS